MTRIRAISDLFGLIVGGIAFIGFIGWLIYQKTRGNI